MMIDHDCSDCTESTWDRLDFHIVLGKILRRIFGRKRNEVTGEWRRLHNKELYVLYSSPNIIRVIKSRRRRWVGHVARMGRGEGNLREGDRMEDPGIDGRIILKWIFERLDGGGIDWINLAQDRDRWRAVVNAVNLGVHKMRGIS
jgi:hypothetical protein